MANAKLKILCLHGYGQNAETFRKKLGGVRKLLKGIADFDFVSSPHVAQPGEELGDPETGPRHAWWLTNIETKTYDSKKFNTNCYGFEESIKCIDSVLEANGPYDGVLGFSQGACFLSLLCCLQQRGELRGRFKFAIFASGYLSRCSAHQTLYDGHIELPTLHIYGETDTVIPEEMSNTLTEVCRDKHIIRHPGGHHIPSNSHFRHPYINFLQCRLSDKTDCPER